MDPAGREIETDSKEIGIVSQDKALKEQSPEQVGKRKKKDAMQDDDAGSLVHHVTRMRRGAVAEAVDCECLTGADKSFFLRGFFPKRTKIYKDKDDEKESEKRSQGPVSIKNGLRANLERPRGQSRVMEAALVVFEHGIDGIGAPFESREIADREA